MTERGFCRYVFSARQKYPPPCYSLQGFSWPAQARDILQIFFPSFFMSPLSQHKGGTFVPRKGGPLITKACSFVHNFFLVRYTNLCYSFLRADFSHIVLWTVLLLLSVSRRIHFPIRKFLLYFLIVSRISDPDWSQTTAGSIARSCISAGSWTT